jgi:hypothetical protein
MTAQDNLTLALAGLDEEVAAVAAFDAARETVVSLIEVRADPAAIFHALDEVYQRLLGTRTAYFHLEEVMISARWSMERPDSLPLALRQAIEAELPHHEEHLARTEEAEQIVGRWLEEEEWRHAEQRYYTARRRTENHHLNRTGRRRKS